MCKTTYFKKHLSFTDQIQKLKSCNLMINDDKFALAKLQKINYYRLSAYFIPFYDENDKFKNGTNFEDIINLYDFDSNLRKILLNYLEIIEIFLRTRIAYYHSKNFGAFGYLEKENFKDLSKDFEMLHNNIKDEKDRSKEVFIKHFKEKYNLDDLPIWAVVEILSFGHISRFFKLLKSHEQRECIEKIDINVDVFSNWMHALSSVRNICAHHARLWNRTLGISFVIPKNHKEFSLVKNNKVYFAICVIEYILTCIDEKSDEFKKDIDDLFFKYKLVDKTKMGYKKEQK